MMAVRKTRLELMHNVLGRKNRWLKAARRENKFLHISSHKPSKQSQVVCLASQLVVLFLRCRAANESESHPNPAQALSS